MKRPNGGPSVCIKAALWLAANPDEHLTTGDIRVKFAEGQPLDSNNLRQGLKNGTLALVSGGKRGGRGGDSVYAAGPETLRVVGRTAA